MPARKLLEDLCTKPFRLLCEMLVQEMDKIDRSWTTPEEFA